MLLFQAILLCLLMGYFFGGLSGGHITGKIYKVDVRQHGSGNLGATNVQRTLGWTAALITFLIDVSKVIGPGLLVRYVLFPQYPPFSNENQLLVLYVAFGAVIGHNFPMSLNFRGGKGVACLAATILLFDWRLAIVELIVFVSIALFVALIVGLLFGLFIGIATFFSFGISIGILYPFCGTMLNNIINPRPPKRSQHQPHVDTETEVMIIEQ